MTTELIAVLVSLVVTTAITTTVGILVKKYFDKRDREQQRLKEVEEQHNKEEIRKIVSEVVTPIQEDVCAITKDLSLLKEGNQALLRAKLYNLSEDCTKKGFATIDEKNNFENIYQKYHALGVNGVMDGVREEFLKLPSTKVIKKKKLNE